MSTTEKKTLETLEAELNAQLEEEEVEDNGPVDPELEKKIKTLQIDGNTFTGEGDETKSKKKKAKQQKDKVAKVQDFHEFAKKNEIDLNIKYEKSPEKKEGGKVNQDSYSKDITQKSNTNYSNNNKKYNNYNNNNTNNNYNKGGYNKSYYNNNNNYKKNNYNNKNYNNKGGFQQKNFNNKFDPMNSYNNNPYMMYPMNNQGMGMRPDMMFYGQMPMNSHNNIPLNNNSNFNNSQMEDHSIIGGKGVKESLEYYFSLDNLNKDLFMRKKIDNDGYIEVEEILKFNNMIKNNATSDTIKDILKESKVLEESQAYGKTFLRNKNWEEIKHNLISVEEIEARKNQKKGNFNYNYVTMQNNYFMPMMPIDPSMFGSQMNHMMPIPNMMGMGMGLNTPYNQLDQNN